MQLHIFEKSVQLCGSAAWRATPEGTTGLEKNSYQNPAMHEMNKCKHIYTATIYLLSGTLFSERLNFLYVSQVPVSPKLTRELMLFSSTQPQ